MAAMGQELFDRRALHQKKKVAHIAGTATDSLSKPQSSKSKTATERPLQGGRPFFRKGPLAPPPTDLER